MLIAAGWQPWIGSGVVIAGATLAAYDAISLAPTRCGSEALPRARVALLAVLTALSICVWVAVDYHYVFLALALASFGSAIASLRCNRRAWHDYVPDLALALAFISLGSVGCARWLVLNADNAR